MFRATGFWSWKTKKKPQSFTTIIDEKVHIIIKKRITKYLTLDGHTLVILDKYGEWLLIVGMKKL